MGGEVRLDGIMGRDTSVRPCKHVCVHVDTRRADPRSGIRASVPAEVRSVRVHAHGHRCTGAPADVHRCAR